jgi:hypothetical protein
MSNPEDRGLTREQDLADLELEDPVMNAKQAAKWAGVCDSTIRRYVRKGKFPNHRRAINDQDLEIPLSDLLKAGFKPSKEGMKVLKRTEDINTLRLRLEKAFDVIRGLETELAEARDQYNRKDAQVEAYLALIKDGSLPAGGTETVERLAA